MSQENVEIVRRFADCWERLDWEGMAELVDPDVEQHGTVGGVEEGGVTRGVSEIRRDYEHVEAIWDEHRIEVQELIDAGDRVVVFQREYQRGRRSGVELVLDAAVLVDVRDGRIVRVQGFMERGAALDAAGLSAQPNVDIVRQGLERFAKTGEPSWEILDQETEVFDHDIPDARNPYRGPDGVRDWLSDFGAAWDRYDMEVERLIDAGDRVVSLVRIRAVGAGSGVAVERGDGMVWTFRNGKLARLDYFNDQEEALRAAGL
jgi:ketosteroid isomerase-like protein